MLNEITRQQITLYQPQLHAMYDDLIAGSQLQRETPSIYSDINHKLGKYGIEDGVAKLASIYTCPPQEPYDGTAIKPSFADKVAAWLMANDIPRETLSPKEIGTVYEHENLKHAAAAQFEEAIIRMTRADYAHRRGPQLDLMISELFGNKSGASPKLGCARLQEFLQAIYRLNINSNIYNFFANKMEGWVEQHHDTIEKTINAALDLETAFNGNGKPVTVRNQATETALRYFIREIVIDTLRGGVETNDFNRHIYELRLDTAKLVRPETLSHIERSLRSDIMKSIATAPDPQHHTNSGMTR